MSGRNKALPTCANGVVHIADKIEKLGQLLNIDVVKICKLSKSDEGETKRINIKKNIFNSNSAPDGSTFLIEKKIGAIQHNEL